ncbi:glycerol-3-phosphate 1-O-acyltransferase PlsY [Paramaledivibacter caminithermalis]|jgi:glycerol-3-phosphate acyltransferase PlsY|uniref:Glycerol-3-phosphate acyltransferase n=1 Tax=Paramaledivibacter caminithermalis (strain DSM 15212 / CIP 107654 / DViRD3) TaxID=1121301 RepID=A0A1M6MI32_PARC5|nr:glycerol-3-phosphate 1-O-acyltransferase PlsY [Paramaledivibacter caminithermalis]SHJ82943.1 glycerol-3-phosphate acyltransferase PlsY [Paramaledivibacter caminithermalis DSM 15212]
MIKFLLPAVFSYFIGSIPFSFLTAKFIGGIDIRNYGSGNSGATNVLRTLGKKAGAIAFLGDFLKGFMVAIIVKKFIGIDIAVICSTFCVIGHCYPIFLGFKGGKGVATTGGTIFALYPLIGAILLACLILIIKASRIVSLASISSALLFPIISFIFKTHKYFLIYSVILGLFVVYKHKSNISRLIAGNESKISFKTPTDKIQ